MQTAAFFNGMGDQGHEALQLPPKVLLPFSEVKLLGSKLFRAKGADENALKTRRRLLC